MNGFWLVVAIACTLWYSTVTIYVTIQGARDIRGMLERLGTERDREDESSERGRDA